MTHSQSDQKLLARVVVATSTIGAIVALCFLGALHAPEPNDVELGVVGAPEQVSPVEQGIDSAAPGAFDISTYPSGEAASEAIRDRQITAAFIPGDSQLELLVAGAGGAIAKNNLIHLGEGLAGASNSAFVVTDLVPLPEDDPAGLSPFLLVVSLLIPSLLFGVLISMAAAGARPRAKLAAALAGGLLLGLTNTLIADTVLGALSGHFWALAGIATLTSWAISLPIIALHRLVGAPGIGLVTLLFVVFGVPATGAAIGPDFIPDFFQVFTLAFPAGEAIPAVRNLTYFDGANVGFSLLLLGSWACVGALGLIAKRATDRTRNGSMQGSS